MTVRFALPVALFCLVGCAGEKQARLSTLNGRDPLMGEKIPPPNVPTGRDRYGLKDGRDPILRADAGRTNPEVAAALATGRPRDPEQPDLRIPDDRRPAGGFASRGSLAPSSGTPAEQLTKELEGYGVRVFSPTRTDAGGYEVRAQVPTGPTGAMSGYVGSGNSPVNALRDVYDQVRADRR